VAASPPVVPGVIDIWLFQSQSVKNVVASTSLKLSKSKNILSFSPVEVILSL
jgi:hypothetical protein